MTGRRRVRTSSLFLMELILAILFFSITGAVCVQFFVKSHIMSQRSKELTQAVNLCSAVAEVCKTADGIEDAQLTLTELYPEGQIIGDGAIREFCVYYDKEFRGCEVKESAYKLSATMSEKDESIYAQIEVTGEEKNTGKQEGESAQIYQLTTTHHLARRTAYE